MQDQDTQDFMRRQWVLRALFLEGVHDEDEGQTEDMFFWFVARPDKDQWFAHGISDLVSDEMADAMEEAFGDGLMGVMLTVAGQPWATITAMPTQIAQSQRDLLDSLLNHESVDELMRMTEEELLEWRAKAESATRRSMN